MSDVEYPIKGACQCGGVTYELLAPPAMVVACHCRECQKLSTSAFSITAMVDADSIRFSGEMQEWSRPAESGNISAAKFCPCCGNRLYHFNPDEPEKIKLKPSTLSDTRIINPTAHVWVSEKQDWYQIPEGVKVFEKQP
ncbi:GFA family protein [Neptuniibacter halophilus]|uniref:GFA family protein n=1 Tax=Neptuniibacter halophilus TaxID=651666 RepID=UPI002572294A|nr:GFA family protein [Neptuniibacter halophilus]